MAFPKHAFSPKYRIQTDDSLVEVITVREKKTLIAFVKDVFCKGCFETHKDVTQTVPNKAIYLNDSTIICHPSMESEVRKLIDH